MHKTTIALLNNLRHTFVTINGLIATDKKDIISKDIEIIIDVKKEIKEIDNYIKELEYEEEGEREEKLANPDWLINK